MTKAKPSKPFIIGVAGGSGSGKTTVVKNLLKVLRKESKQQVVCISHDDFYRNQDHLPMSERVKTNYDHPSALETDLLIKLLKDLIDGQTIEKPTYDFVIHTRFPKTEQVKPAKVIVVEGILLFENKDLRDMFDLKVFVDTDADLRVLRKVERDIKKRGRTFEFVVDQYLRFTRPMHLEFVEPNKRYADIIIPEGGHNTVALDLLLAKVKTVSKH